MQLLLLYAFEADVQIQRLRRRAWAFDAEVVQVQRRSTVEAGTVAAPWILAFAVEGCLDDDWLGHAVQGQVASDVSRFLASRFDCGGNEFGLRVFGNVQEVFAGDVFVALSVVGEQAGGFQIDVDFTGFRLGSIEAERAVPVLEGTVDEAVARWLIFQSMKACWPSLSIL